MSVSDELGKLGDLHQRGLLSDEEFARAKARVLEGATAAGGAPGAGAARGSSGPQAAINALRRSLTDRWIGGVCGGVAQLGVGCPDARISPDKGRHLPCLVAEGCNVG
jgi:hypothetical protein